MWLFIHLMNLVSFRNRILVFVQWAWSYITYDRAARLITGELPAERADRQKHE
jgi:NADH dehydrogenase